MASREAARSQGKVRSQQQVPLLCPDRQLLVGLVASATTRGAAFLCSGLLLLEVFYLHILNFYVLH